MDHESDQVACSTTVDYNKHTDEVTWATRSLGGEWTGADGDGLTTEGELSSASNSPSRSNKKKFYRKEKLIRGHRLTSRSLTDLTHVKLVNDEIRGASSKPNGSENNDANQTSGFTSFNKQQKLTLVCLALINFGSYLSMSIIAPFFPVEAELKGVSLSVTGYVFSVYALVMFAVSPIIGKLIPLVGVKFTFVSGVFLAAGCNILFGALNYVNDTLIFTCLCFLLRGFEAIGSASFFTAACTIVAENFRDDVGSAYGLMETFMGIGMTAGPAIGSALYSLGGYELPFYTLGSFLMVTVPISMVILPNSPVTVGDENSSNSSSSQKQATFWQLLKLPEIITISMIVMVLCGTWGFLDPVLEPHLREFGITPRTIGLLFLAMAGTYSITCPIVGKVVDKWGYEVIMMAFGLILTAVCLFLMGPAILFPFIPRNLVLNIIGLVFMGITIGVGFIPTLQYMLECAYSRNFEENTVTFGLVSSIFSSVSSFGEFIGPAVGGIMFEKYSFDFAATVVGFVSLAIAIILILYRSFKTRISTKSDTSNSTSSIVSVSEGGDYNCTERTPLISRSSSV